MTMTDKNDNELADLLAYQRSLCDEEMLMALDQSTRPSPARFYSVARGDSMWTSQERSVIDADPRLQEYELKMRAAMRSAKSKSVTIPLRRAVSTIPVKPELHAAALASCQSSDPIRFLNTEDGYDLFLFPADENGLVTVRFFGTIPQTPFILMAGESPLEFVKPIDQVGYAVVRAEHVHSVLSGLSELYVRIE